MIDDVLTPTALAAWQRIERLQKCQPSFGSISPELDGISYFSEVALSGIDLEKRYVDEVRRGISLGCEHLGSSDFLGLDRLRFWRYPRGTGLDWHDDGSGRSVAVTFYLSPEWRAHWGGELDIIDCSTEQVPCIYSVVPRDLMNAPVPPVTLFPRPNRLILMTAGTFHRVRRVDANAGEHLRRSFTAFLGERG